MDRPGTRPLNRGTGGRTGTRALHRVSFRAPHHSKSRHRGRVDPDDSLDAGNSESMASGHQDRRHYCCVPGEELPTQGRLQKGASPSISYAAKGRNATASSKGFATRRRLESHPSTRDAAPSGRDFMRLPEQRRRVTALGRPDYDLRILFCSAPTCLVCLRSRLSLDDGW